MTSQMYRAAIATDVARLLNGYQFPVRTLDDLTDGTWSRLNGCKTAEQIDRDNHFSYFGKVQTIGMVDEVNGRKDQVMRVDLYLLVELIGYSAVKDAMRNGMMAEYDDEDVLFILEWPYKRKGRDGHYAAFSKYSSTTRIDHASIDLLKFMNSSHKIVYTNGFEFSEKNFNFYSRPDGNWKTLFSKKVSEIVEEIRLSYTSSKKEVNHNGDQRPSLYSPSVSVC